LFFFIVMKISIMYTNKNKLIFNKNLINNLHS